MNKTLLEKSQILIYEKGSNVLFVKTYEEKQ